VIDSGAYEELDRGFQGDIPNSVVCACPKTYTASGLVAGSAEFPGPYEETGWGLAAIPILSIAWSVWLRAMGGCGADRMIILPKEADGRA
jgi:hypothetical protein